MHSCWRRRWRSPGWRRVEPACLGRLDGGYLAAAPVPALGLGPRLLGRAAGGLVLELDSDVPHDPGIVDLGHNVRQRQVPQTLGALGVLGALGRLGAPGVVAALPARPHHGHGAHRLSNGRNVKGLAPRYRGGRGGADSSPRLSGLRPASDCPTRPWGSGLVEPLGAVAGMAPPALPRRWGSRRRSLAVLVPGKGHAPRHGAGGYWTGVGNGRRGRAS